MDDKPMGSKYNKAPASDAKKSTLNAGMLLVILLAVSVTAFLGILYYNSTNEVSDQKRSVSALQGQLDKLLKKPRLEDAPVSPPVRDGSEVSVVPSCNGGSSYSASVGKFDITLSDPNVVVRKLDGGFEGGPITQVSVGQCASGENNVVDLTLTGEITILAHPASTSADLRSSYEGQNGVTLTAGSTMTIDGVSAQIYTNSGLFDQKFLYFDNNSIGYQIEVMDDSTSTAAVLTDITSDWSFTP